MRHHSDRADHHDDDDVDQQRLHSSLPGHFPWWDRGSGKRDENHRSTRVTIDWAGHDITTRHRIRNCDSRKDEGSLQCLTGLTGTSQFTGSRKKDSDHYKPVDLSSLVTWMATMSPPDLMIIFTFLFLVVITSTQSHPLL